MRACALKPTALPQKLKPLSLGPGKHSEGFKCGIFGIDCSWSLDRKGAVLFRDDLCVFLFTSLHPSGLCCVCLPFLLHFQHLLSTALVLVSVGGPFLLGCQALCSQSGPIRSILLFLLPQSTDPFQYIWVVLLWDDLEEGECVASGKVWAEEQCLLVERILVSQGTWSQEAPGIKGL